MASISARRLAKELREIQAEGCPVGESFVRLLPVSTVLDYAQPGSLCSGITLLEANDFARWLFTIEVMGDSLYQVRFEHPFSCYHVLIINLGRGLHASIQIRCTIPHFLPSRSVCSDGRKRITYPSCSFSLNSLVTVLMLTDIFLTLAARLLQRACKDNLYIPFQRCPHRLSVSRCRYARLF